MDILFPLQLLGSTDMGVDLIQAIRENDLMGLGCIVLLLLLSFLTGFYMFAKWSEIRHATRQSEEFIEECMEEQKSLPEIYLASKDFPQSPLAALLREAYMEYEMEARNQTTADLPFEQRLMIGRASVESALERTIAAEMRKLESRLVHLATASTLGPFIGLFGTVWGILGTFQAIGREGSAGMEILAPGVSTALVTTIFGLIVAIPAAAMYNYLAAQVAHMGSQMDSFAHELSNVFQKHLLKRGIDR